MFLRFHEADNMIFTIFAVNDKIYMHGGYTRKTQPTVEYANDLWILDTKTWQWTAGSDSPSGRSSHTLISYQGLLLSVSGKVIVRSEKGGD